MDFRLLLVVIICYQNQKSLSSSLRVILVRLENRTIGVNLAKVNLLRPDDFQVP